MARVDGQNVRTRVSLLTAVGLCGTAAAVTWALTSIGLYDGPDHLIGPFTVPLAIEWSVGAAAVGLAILGLLLARGDRRPPVAWTLSASAVGWLVITVVLASAGWRVVTVGGGGANIGGGAVLLLGPIVLAVLLQVAIGTEAESRGPSARGAVLLSACLWLAALGLSATSWFASA